MISATIFAPVTSETSMSKIKYKFKIHKNPKAENEVVVVLENEIGDVLIESTTLTRKHNAKKNIRIVRKAILDADVFDCTGDKPKRIVLDL